jgi:hypothetical protein
MPHGPCSDGPLEPIRGVGRGFVFPDPKNQPSCLGERRVGESIAQYVRFQLSPPPFGIRLRPSRMLGTTVPEATIHKHSHPLRWEHQVGTRPDGRNDGSVKTKTQTTAMKLRPNSTFRSRVPPAQAAHPLGDAWGRSRWAGRRHRYVTVADGGDRGAQLHPSAFDLEACGRLSVQLASPTPAVVGGASKARDTRRRRAQRDADDEGLSLESLLRASHSSSHRRVVTRARLP